MHPRASDKSQYDVIDENETAFIIAIYGIAGLIVGNLHGNAGVACAGSIASLLSEECSRYVTNSTMIGTAIGLSIGAGVSLYHKYFVKPLYETPQHGKQNFAARQENNLRLRHN